MSKSRNIFITGGNRGIGLGLVEEILKQFKPDNLFATFRDASSAKKLEALAAKNPSLHLIQMDVRDNETKLHQIVKTVDEKTKGAGLNLLINNSGVIGQRGGFLSASKEDMLETYEVNTVAPFMLTKAFLPLLEKASSSPSGQSTNPGIGRAAIVNISTILASIASVQMTGGGDYYAYRGSKAALNIITAALSQELKKSNILVVAIHPGWVQTDMGGSNATTTVGESTTGLINVIAALDESKNGKFYNFEGNELPW